ncbi:hypothetical protein N6H14_28825 [Paenibacillus sp. CC-CFT747]|nr:hypothetical protein N6H14_28825 [Paenibacillus sp. CC-CFT747]
MAAVCFAAGLMEPIAAGYLHHRIPSPMRATIDSFQSLGQNGWSALAGLGFGYLSIHYEIFGGYGFLALLCAISFIGFVLLYPRTRAVKPSMGN